MPDSEKLGWFLRHQQLLRLSVVLVSVGAQRSLLNGSLWNQNAGQALTQSLIPCKERHGRLFTPLNFAFHVRSGRLQPGGPDERSFPFAFLCRCAVCEYTCTCTHTLLRGLWSQPQVHTHSPAPCWPQTAAERMSGEDFAALHKSQSFRYVHSRTGAGASQRSTAHSFAAVRT